MSPLHREDRRQPAAPAGDLRRIDPVATPPDAALVLDFDPVEALRLGVLPWRRIAGQTVVLCSRLDRFREVQARLEVRLGPCRPALAQPHAIERALHLVAGPALAHRAETLAPSEASCRNLSGARIRAAGTLALTGTGTALALAPLATAQVLTALTLALLLAWTALRASALALSFLPQKPTADGNVVMATFPRITLLVPLFHERDIADHLLARLAALRYPRDRLQVLLILEDNDRQTRAVLDRTDLPHWMTPVTVPEGRIRTKPRALNFALPLATGDIIGIYDAEDAPAPDQLLQVATRFGCRPRKVACLQGRLDFFNPRATWMTRCFALDYAAWFRVILPALSRLGLPLPLGGTTLFLRRDVLEEVGGWDAHNVTEDADLGLRLYRHGYRTELIDSVTEEEANGRPLPWIRQRSRWQKGYAVTWLVHMRRPGALWRDLGPAGFAFVQVLLLGTLIQAAAAPILWLFALSGAGLIPAAALPAGNGALVLALALLACEGIGWLTAWRGAALAGKSRLALWLPALIPYFALATVSVAKAIGELVWSPFYWDKTAHGVLAIPPLPPSGHRA